jgi:formyl-CoA transferase
VSLPLAGVKVVDLSRALAGPFCAMILGDLGADVVKVEPAPDGEIIHRWGPTETVRSL